MLYPNLKLNKQVLQFGECPCHDRKDFILTIKNQNEDLPIDFNFTKVANFKCEPQKGKLLPATKHMITVSFEPKSFGIFSNMINLQFLKNSYQIPITLMGSSNSMQSKQKMIRGPLATKEDFESKRNYLSKDEVEPAQYIRVKTQNEFEIPKHLLESTSLEMDSALKMENSEMLDQYLITKKVKDDYNNYITDKRIVREKKKRVVITTKRRGNALPMSVEEIEADPDIGLDDFNLGYQEPQFQTEQFALSIVKPIEKYEPMQVDAISRQNFKYDENKIIKKKDKPEPTTQTEIRDFNEELDSTKLQKIFVGSQ